MLGSVGLFLTLGKYNLLFRFYARLPIIGLFRAPARYFVLTDFAVSAGAALTLDRLRKLSGTFSLSRFMRWLGVCLGSISLATAAITLLPKLFRMTGLQPRVPFLSELLLHMNAPWKVGAGALMVTMGVILFLISGRPHRIAQSGIVLFVLLEVLCIQGRALIHLPVGDPFQITNLPPMPPPGPIQVPAFNDTFLLLNYQLVNGYSGLPPSSPFPMGSPIYARIMGARAAWSTGWKIVPDPLPLLRLVNRSVLMTNRAALIRDTDIMSLATIMGKPFTPPNLERDLNQVMNFNFSRSALVEVPLSLNSESIGSLNLVENRPGYLKIISDATGTMLATTGVRFHSGWKITTDGKPQDILRVDGNLLGFTIPVGRHLIECHFDPADFRYGELISLCALVGTILYLAMFFVVKSVMGKHFKLTS